MAIYYCKICRKRCSAKPSRNRKYCSLKCADSDVERKRKQSESVKRNWRDSKYREHMIEVHSGKTGELSSNWQGGKKRRICLICKEEFYIPKNYVEKKRGIYCSRKCFGIGQAEKLRGERSPHWCGGKSFEPYGLTFTNKLRKEIRMRDNYKCQICEIVQNGRKMSIHHIDYDKTNNKEWNLITLCHSCHSKTNTNRGYWQPFLGNTMEIRA